MHMADALLSPAVGGAFIAASGVTLAVSARKIAQDPDDRKVPLMGVMGAFVFAAQMINFTIPATGSSGHLGGGMLLAILLGPYRAFITIASVLVVQALLFADGGLLALGTNIWNLGFYPCFIGILIYKVIAGSKPSPARISAAAMVSALIALEMGAFSVAVETVLSGRSELPFGRFAAVMLGIHLPIGLVEGLVTVTVVNFIRRLRPEILDESPAAGSRSWKPALVAMIALAVFTGGGLAWFASAHPDGLEWSIARVTGTEELADEGEGIKKTLAEVQTATALLPDYGFKSPGPEGPVETGNPGDGEAEESWPAVSAGTSVSGIIGSAVVLGLAGLIGFIAFRLRGKPTPE